MKGGIPSSKRSLAFSIVELMVVIVLLLIVASFVIPSITGLIASSALTRSGGLIESNLALASQIALAKQCRVEARFYKYDNPEAVGDEKTYCAMQLFEETTSGSGGTNEVHWRPLDKPVVLPTPNIILDTAEYSTLLTNAATQPSQSDLTDKPSLPNGVGTSYDFRKIVFLGANGTELPNDGGLYFLTIADSRKDPPKNFYTIKVAPLTGKVTSYRP